MTNNHSLNNLTAPFNNPIVLDYCKKLLNYYINYKSAEKFKSLHNAVQEHFPSQLTIETSNNAIIIKNYYYSLSYDTSVVNPYIRFAIDCSIQSKNNNECVEISLYSDIFENRAQETPHVSGLNDHEALKQLSNEQFNDLIEAIKQTVNSFIKAVEIVQQQF